jgi:hypothetical protein
MIKNILLIFSSFFVGTLSATNTIYNKIEISNNELCSLINEKQEHLAFIDIFDTVLFSSNTNNIKKTHINYFKNSNLHSTISLSKYPYYRTIKDERNYNKYINIISKLSSNTNKQIEIDGRLWQEVKYNNFKKINNNHEELEKHILILIDKILHNKNINKKEIIEQFAELDGLLNDNQSDDSTYDLLDLVDIYQYRTNIVVESFSARWILADKIFNILHKIFLDDIKTLNLTKNNTYSSNQENLDVIYFKFTPSILQQFRSHLAYPGKYEINNDKYINNNSQISDEFIVLDVFVNFLNRNTSPHMSVLKLYSTIDSLSNLLFLVITDLVKGTYDITDIKMKEKDRMTFMFGAKAASNFIDCISNDSLYTNKDSKIMTFFDNNHYSTFKQSFNSLKNLFQQIKNNRKILAHSLFDQSGGPGYNQTFSGARFGVTKQTLGKMKGLISKIINDKEIINENSTAIANTIKYINHESTKLDLTLLKNNLIEDFSLFVVNDKLINNIANNVAFMTRKDSIIFLDKTKEELINYSKSLDLELDNINTKIKDAHDLIDSILANIVEDKYNNFSYTTSAKIIMNQKLEESKNTMHSVLLNEYQSNVEKRKEIIKILVDNINNLSNTIKNSENKTISKQYSLSSKLIIDLSKAYLKKINSPITITGEYSNLNEFIKENIMSFSDLIQEKPLRFIHIFDAKTN